MSKKHLLLIAGMLTAASLVGCGKEETKEETEFTTDAPSDVAEEDVVLEDTVEDTEEADEFAPITPSDYLIEDVSNYVKLGDLSELKANQYIYEVTDEMVQEQIQNDLQYMAEEEEVDRAAKAGDLVYADIKSTVQGKDDTSYSESTYFTLGDAEYGEDFDRELMGASAGDTLKFSCSYSDDTWMDEWVDQTVDFEVSVTSICQLNVPEYNDEYVKENTDYSTKEEFEESVRESLTSEYEDMGYSDAVDSLFEAAIEASQFSGYPEDLYDSCRQEILDTYLSFLGGDSEEDVYETFDMTAEDIDNEALSTVNRRLLISAISEENEIDFTEEDYFEFVENYAAYYGYDNAVQFEEDITRTALVWAMYENEVAQILYDNAEITPITYEEADDDFIEEESELSPDDTGLEDVSEEDSEASSEAEFEEETEALEEFSINENETESTT